MLVRQKKLTLHTPYNKINDVLWQSKRLNSQQLTQNTQLKTHVQQIERRTRVNGNEVQVNKKIVQKYQKLTQTFKNQAVIIENINSQIQERNYQQLKLVVKKIENKLNSTAVKALKLEKKLKLAMKKAEKAQENNFVAFQDDSTIENLQKEQKDLQKNLQDKQRCLMQVQTKNKELNRQLLNLLTIKNKLREECKEISKNQHRHFTNCESKDRVVKG